MPPMKFDEQLLSNGGNIDVAAQIRQNSQVLQELDTAFAQDGSAVGAVRRSYGLPVLKDEIEDELDL